MRQVRLSSKQHRKTGTRISRSQGSCECKVGAGREELLFRDRWEEETQREVVIESLKADCEVRTGRPLG
jgi:hypothetical protein